MATEVPIGTRGTAKIRNIWAVALLPFVTLGIYSLFWWYYINREMMELGQEKQVDLGDSPAKSVLAIFPGGIIIVPAIMSLIGTFQRIKRSQELAGSPDPINGWILLVLLLVLSPAGYAYMQNALNDVWARQGAPASPAAPVASDPV